MSTTPLLCIVGPTATGKTALSIALSELLRGEVVSCDSMQVYRGMDIGTAKPTLSERAGIPHHMLDIVEPNEDYNAARYAEEAARVIEDIHARGCRPIVCGGTGLYLRALLYGLHDIGSDETGAVQAELESYLATEGEAALYLRLQDADPETATRLHPSDTRRVLRALEVYTRTGTPLSEHHRRSRETKPRFDAWIVGLRPTDRAALYAQIDRRVDEMRAGGLWGEVEGLLARGLSADCTAMQAIGYKEIATAILSGAKSDAERDDVFALIAQATRRYAKRQLTWFSREPDLVWLDIDGTNPLELSTKIVEIFGLR